MIVYWEVMYLTGGTFGAGTDWSAQFTTSGTFGCPVATVAGELFIPSLT